MTIRTLQKTTKHVYSLSYLKLFPFLLFLSGGFSSAYATHGDHKGLEALLVRELPMAQGQKVQLSYSANKQGVEADVLDERGHLTHVKSYDLPRELLQIESLEAFKALTQNVYVRLHRFNNGDVSFFLYQQGFGGGQLHDAAMEEDMTQLTLLLKNPSVRSQINEQDADNRTPLHCAASSGQLEAVRLLLDQGADINSINADGMTALHLSVQSYSTDICKLLLSRGINFEIQDEHGRTALQLAFENANGEAFQLFEEWSKSHVSSQSQALQSTSFTFPTDITEAAFRQHLQQNPHIEKLDLTGCAHLTEESLWLLKNMRKMQELILSNCTQVTPQLVDFFVARLKPSLKKLDLTGIFEIPRETFLALQQAGIAFAPEGALDETLDCSSNQTIDEDELIEKLTMHPNIRTLSLKGCRFIKEAGLQRLTRLKELTTLDLSSCPQITDASLKFLAERCSGLRSLDLSHCAGVTGSGLDFLVEKAHLQTFALNHTHVPLETAQKAYRKGIHLSINGCDQLKNQCIETLKGHTGAVRSVIQLRDGRLASGSRDGSVRIWDMFTGQCVSTLWCSTWADANINSITELPDGRIAAGTFQGYIQIFDLATGKRTDISTPSWIGSLARLSDGRLACSSDYFSLPSSTITVWDVVSGQCTATYAGHTGKISSLAQLTDGRLAAGSDDKTIKLWDIKDGRCTATLKGHGIRWSFFIEKICALTQLADGRLASGSEDRTIKLWDVTDGRCTATYAGHTGQISSLAQLTDGRLASGSQDRTIKLWDVTDGRCTATLKGHTGEISSFAQLTDRRLASGSDDKTIKLWGV